MKIRLSASALIVENDKILLIKFEDKTGVHYNLPGGGVDKGESVIAAVQRECMEEACVDVNVEGLVGSWEYVPELQDFVFGPKQKVGLIFRCSLKAGSKPAMPVNPDEDQIGFEWVPIKDLDLPVSRRPVIYPQIGGHLLAAIRGESAAFFATCV